MANCGVSLVKYDLDQSPPPDECLLGNADNVPAHLVFSPDELVFNPKAWMRVVKNFHKEWLFMIVSSHESHKVEVPLYVYALRLLSTPDMNARGSSSESGSMTVSSA